MIFYFFFFSSRRRHTRYWRDWSSDVCSSDLTPITMAGDSQTTALVFTKYYTEGEILDTEEALGRIGFLALLAGALALLIAGFSGYVVADLLSRRLSRLDVAARRLASGNFDERITTRIEDEVGSLGETFNAMASSLKGAFRQAEQEDRKSTRLNSSH